MVHVRIEAYDKVNEACMDTCHFDTHFSRRKMKKKNPNGQKTVFSHFWLKNGNFWSWYMWELQFITSWMKPVCTGVILTPILAKEKWKNMQMAKTKQFLAIFRLKNGKTIAIFSHDKCESWSLWQVEWSLYGHVSFCHPF